MKNPLLFLITLIIGIGALNSAAPAKAVTITDDGEVWWTPYELAEYYNAKNEQRENLCQGDGDCNMALIEEDMQDGMYATGYNIFGEGRFIISSINRDENTIEVYFDNNDINVSAYNYLYRDSDLLALYIGWYEDTPYRIYNLTERHFDDEEPGKHILYSETISKMNAGWIPSQTFTTISADEPLKDNTSGIFGIVASSAFFASQGPVDLSGCSSDTDDWSICNLSISINSEMKYSGVTIGTEPSTPPEENEPNHTDNTNNANDSNTTDNTPENPTTTPESPDNSEPTSNPSDNSAENQSVSTPESTPAAEPSTQVAEPSPSVTVPSSDSTVALITSTNATGATSGSTNTDSTEAENATESSTAPEIKSTIDVPLASSPAPGNKTCGKTDFPWWFFIMILTGDIIAVWLFLPRRRRN